MPGSEIALIPPARDLAPAAAGAEVERLVGEAAEFIDAAKASNTRRAYNSAWRAFVNWCAPLGLVTLPASAETVVIYLTAQRGRLSFSTLALHRAAIDDAHRASDLPPPDNAVLREFWAGCRRVLARPPVKKRALIAADLRRVVKRIPDTLTGRRDRALILLGWAGALRRSELAVLELESDAGIYAPLRVRFVSDGLEIIIDRAKGDQSGKGAVVAVPHGARAETCPISALQTWLSSAAIAGGPIFRRIGRGDRIGSEAINDRTVARVVKSAVERVGLRSDIFAGHSLRSGMITSAAKAGAAPDKLQRHVRHARWDTTQGYIQDAERFDRNPLGKML